MRNISLGRKIIIALLGVCLVISGMLFLTNYKKASAFTLGTFEMDLGAYAKVNGGAGLRMRVKLDSTTKEEAEKEGNTLFFLLMSEEKFNEAETTTPGEYDFSPYVAGTHTFGVDGYVRVDADTNKIYKDRGGLYSNLLIYNIPEDYRTINLCVVAGITDGEDSTFASFDTPSQVCKKYYEVVNAVALDGFMEEVSSITDYTSWYGTSNYPIYVKNDTQYNSLKASVDAQDVDLSSKFVDFGDAVTRDANFEGNNLSADKIAEELDVSFDFDLSLGSSTYSAKVAEINGELSTDAINRVTFDNGENIAFTKDAVNSELDFANATVNAFGTGEHTVRVITDAKIYKVKLTPVTEIITNATRFKLVTKASNADDYYILGADISVGQMYAQTRVTLDGEINKAAADFKGVLDGRGYIVSDMALARNNSYPSSLIYKLSGTVKNIAFVNASVDSYNKSGNGGSGALCCNLTGGTIENVYMDVALKNSDAGSACGLYFNSQFAHANVKNCVVIATVQDGSTGTHRVFGEKSYSNTVADTYAVSEIERLDGTYGNSGLLNTCVKYDNASDFFDAVDELPAANGWSKYWSITNDGLNFIAPDTPAGDANITGLFNFSQGGVIAQPGAGTVGNTNSGVTNDVYSGYVDISEYKGKTLAITMIKSAYYGLAFYDSNKSVITPAVNKNQDDSAGKVYDVVIPETACYIRTTYYNPNGAYADILAAHPFSAIIRDGQAAVSGVRTVLAKPVAE